MADPLKKVEAFGEEAFHAVGEFSEEVVKGFKRLTRLHLPQKKGEKPLKRSKTGYETEMFVLDGNGRIDTTGALLKAATQKRLHVDPEASTSMIEVLCLPHHHHRSTSIWLLSNIRQLSDLAEKEGFLLYPFGAYPGKQRPVIYKKPWYQMCARVLGDERFRNSAGTCAGFHQHYTLPRGLFDHKKRTLKYMTTSKLRRTLLDSYNFMIAADPALTCLMQSSPFWQGKRLAKDSRMLMYRAMGYPKGKYAKRDMYILGDLPPYETTLRDLLQRIHDRRVRWYELMQERGMDLAQVASANAMAFTWNPVKINPKGTFEYRGPDMNFLSNVFATSTMIKFALRRIQQDFLLVTPMDIDVKDAFKVEGNRLFIPPHSLVRGDLQHASAHRGLDDKELRTYCGRFYRFAKEEIKRFDTDYLPLLKPVRKMLDSGRTVSDRMLLHARRAGYRDSLPQEYAAEFARTYAEKFAKDVYTVEAVLKKAGEYD